jgi:hypothetical protein
MSPALIGRVYGGHMTAQATAVSPQALIEAAKGTITAYNEKNWDELRRLVTSDFIYDEVSTGRKAEGFDAVLPLWQDGPRPFPIPGAHSTTHLPVATVWYWK